MVVYDVSRRKHRFKRIQEKGAARGHAHACVDCPAPACMFKALECVESGLSMCSFGARCGDEALGRFASTQRPNNRPRILVCARKYRERAKTLPVSNLNRLHSPPLIRTRSREDAISWPRSREGEWPSVHYGTAKLSEQRAPPTWATIIFLTPDSGISFHSRPALLLRSVLATRVSRCRLCLHDRMGLARLGLRILANDFVPQLRSVRWRSPWTSFFDETHQAHYYHNTVTDETTWERPVATVLAASPRASSPIADAEDSIAESVKPTPDLKDKKAPPPEAGADEAPKNPPASTSSASTDDPTSASDRHESPLRGKSSPSSPEASAVAPSPAAPDLRPSTLVWWSDAGDVWNGVSLSGLLTGYGPRRYRNLGGGYYMITLEMGPEWAAAAAAALGQGVADPAAAARLDWVSCSASAPGYGLFLRWAGEDDEQKLFDVPDEFFDDPPPDPRIAAAEEAAANAAAAQAAATAEALAAVENAEAEADAAAAVAATEQAEAAGSEAAAAVAAASAVALPAAPPTTATATATTVKKRKGKGSSAGAIGKKRKGAASLIDKWRAVASTAGEEAEKEAEKQEKMERWKARAAAADPDNPNFMPLGRRRK